MSNGAFDHACSMVDLVSNQTNDNQVLPMIATTSSFSVATRRAISLAAITAALAFGVSSCGGSDSTASVPETSVAPASADVPADLVNINTATEAELLTIPGVGAEIADEIMEYRPYDSFEKYRDEMSKYIPDDEIARIETYLTLG